MTRINCIPVEELTNKHLLAEYRELPRVFKLARPPRKGEKFPDEYTMGAGHVKFFYDKLGYLQRRQWDIINEGNRRGFLLRYTEAPKLTPEQLSSGLCNDWKPTTQAMRINRARINQRLKESSNEANVISHR